MKLKLKLPAVLDTLISLEIKRSTWLSSAPESRHEILEVGKTSAYSSSEERSLPTLPANGCNQLEQPSTPKVVGTSRY